MKQRIDIYWLIPAKPYRELFRQLISVLAKELDAPRFQPHLTLCAAQDRQLPTHAPIRLRVRELAYSAEYTKTLFVRFQPNEALRKLVVDLGGKPLRDPHVSLIYKRLPAPTKSALSRTIKLPFRTVVFDTIKIARCISPTASRADVESWRIVS